MSPVLILLKQLDRPVQHYRHCCHIRIQPRSDEASSYSTQPNRFFVSTPRTRDNPEDRAGGGLECIAKNLEISCDGNNRHYSIRLDLDQTIADDKLRKT
jgi:hypothetical protein